MCVWMVSFSKMVALPLCRYAAKAGRSLGTAACEGGEGGRAASLALRAVQQGLHQAVVLVRLAAYEGDLAVGRVLAQLQHADGMDVEEVGAGLGEDANAQALGYQRGEGGKRLEVDAASGERGVARDVARGQSAADGGLAQVSSRHLLAAMGQKG